MPIVGAEWIARAPEAELHLHLQGALRPATLLELARRHQVALPADDLASLRAWFRSCDFAHFVEVCALLGAFLVESTDYELVAFGLGAVLALSMFATPRRPSARVQMSVADCARHSSTA